MAKWRWGKVDRVGHNALSEEGQSPAPASHPHQWGLEDPCCPPAVMEHLTWPTGIATLAPMYQFHFSCKSSFSQHFTKALEMSKMLFFIKSMKIIFQ